LEERQAMRVGGLGPVRIDVRFIAATHRDLEAEVARGAFRQDLYYRLNGFLISVPPLRERVDEIRPLAEHFVAAGGREMGRASVPSIDPEATLLLERHRWPGNVRELRNAMERAVVLATSGPITRAHLPPFVGAAGVGTPTTLPPSPEGLARSQPSPPPS